MQLFTFFATTATNIPAMIVQSHRPVRKDFFANGIEGAADGFDKRCLSRTTGFFQSTEAAVLDHRRTRIAREGQVVITGKHTVLASHNTRHQVAVAVCIGHALTVNNSLGRSTEVLPHRINAVFYLHHLIEVDGSAGITLYTADAATHFQVTAELFCEDVRRDQHIGYLQDRR